MQASHLVLARMSAACCVCNALSFTECESCTSLVSTHPESTGAGELTLWRGTR